jgi:hypothetical protein
MSDAKTEGHFVEVRYHDQIVDEKAKFEELQLNGGFVHCESPMPVGSRLTMKLRAGDDPSSKAVGPHLVATVTHVEEASSRAQTTLSGMQLALEEGDEKVQEFLSKVIDGTSPAEAAGEEFEEEPPPDAYEPVAAGLPASAESPSERGDEQGGEEESEEQPSRAAPEENQAEPAAEEAPPEEDAPSEKQESEDATESQDEQPETDEQPEGEEQQPSIAEEEAPSNDDSDGSVSGEIVSGEIGQGFDEPTMEIDAEVPAEGDLPPEDANQWDRSKTVRDIPAVLPPEDQEDQGEGGEDKGSEEEKEKSEGKEEKKAPKKKKKKKKKKSDEDDSSGDESSETDSEEDNDGGKKKKRRRGRRSRKKKKK